MTIHTHTERPSAAPAADLKDRAAPRVTPTLVPVVLGCLLGVGAVLVGVLAFQH